MMLFVFFTPLLCGRRRNLVNFGITEQWLGTEDQRLLQASEPPLRWKKAVHPTPAVRLLKSKKGCVTQKLRRQAAIECSRTEPQKKVMIFDL